MSLRQFVVSQKLGKEFKMEKGGRGKNSKLAATIYTPVIIGKILNKTKKDRYNFYKNNIKYLGFLVMGEQ